VTLFALAAVGNRGSTPTIASWHLENALPQTAVSDVVASIVTDFRGMDTLIEINVFGMAALGVLALLAGTRANEKKEGEHPEKAFKRVNTRKKPSPHHTVLNFPMRSIGWRHESFCRWHC